MRYYIAGPMKGYDLWNFPAFDSAKESLTEAGHFALSPADLDRLWGMDEANYPELPDWFDLGAVLMRDLEMIRHVDGLFLLRGWEKSVGANIERAFADALGLVLTDQRDWEGLTP